VADCCESVGGAGAFGCAWRLVDVLEGVAAGTVTRVQAEDVVYRMFEPHMDEYLDEEIEHAKRRYETVCRDWERKVRIGHLPSPAL
jgi:recyclin-1